jgi:dTDP-glucose 4,6-dehydratase
VASFLKSLLVAGGAGFIGSHLSAALVENFDCDKLFIVDNLVTGSVDNIGDLIGSEKVEFIEGDIVELDKLSLETIKFSHILNFASIASPKTYAEKSIETLQTGSLGVFNLLDLAKSSGARFIHASTSEIYGDPMVHPQIETYYGNVNSVGPRSMYDEAKRFGEATVTAYHSKFGLSYALVRIFNTYGPKMGQNDGRVIPNFVNAALNNLDLEVYGDGLQTRSLCYVSDLVSGILKLTQSEFCGPINLGNPSEITVIDLAKKIIKSLNTTSKIIHLEGLADDPRQRCPDITLAKKVLNWEPEISFETGLLKTSEYFKLINSGAD